MANFIDELYRVYLRQIYTFMKYGRDYYPDSIITISQLMEDQPVTMTAASILCVQNSVSDVNIDPFIFNSPKFHSDWNVYLQQFKRNKISLTGSQNIPSLIVYEPTKHELLENKIVIRQSDPLLINQPIHCSDQLERYVDKDSTNLESTSDKHPLSVDESQTSVDEIRLIPNDNPEERNPRKRSLVDEVNLTKRLKIDREMSLILRSNSFNIKTETFMHFISYSAIKYIYVYTPQRNYDRIEYRDNIYFIASKDIRLRYNAFKVYILTNVITNEIPCDGIILTNKLDDKALERAWRGHVNVPLA